MKDEQAIPIFVKEVQSDFDFLQQAGFVCVSGSPFKVRFESKKVFIEISHEQRDGEVSISFGRSDQNEEFSFILFLRLVNSVLQKELGENLANRPEELHQCVKRLATALEAEGKQIIAGNDSVFERMKSVRWYDFQPEALKKNRVP
jgi:hypothetical protein